MKANGNFGNVKASTGGGFQLLPAGAYACRIHSVYDHTGERTPSLEFHYDVLDPATKRTMYAADLDRGEGWKHSFRIFFANAERGWAQYKALVEAVEGSEQNMGFQYQDVDGAEQTLVGKWVGIVFRHKTRVVPSGKHAGKTVTDLDANGFVTCADALEGKFPARWAEPWDARTDEQREAAAQAELAASAPVVVAEEDIPF